MDSQVNGEIRTLYRQAEAKLTEFRVSIGHRSRAADTFEERRRAIIRKCHEEDEYQVDEYSDHDFESLRAIPLTISALLKWEPESRISAQQALSLIQWVDYRNGA